jgi:hypothetical protein
MWRVVFAAGNLVRELGLVQQNCALASAYSSEERNALQAATAAASGLQETLGNFTLLANDQAVYMEKSNLRALRRAQKESTQVLVGKLQRVLSGAREMKATAEAGRRFDDNYLKKAGCVRYELAPLNLSGLMALIEGIESHPDDHFLLATEMAAADAATEEAEVIVNAAAIGCWLGGRKGHNAALEIRKKQALIIQALVSFEPLIVRRLEWEESVVGEPIVVQEQ